VVISFNNKSVLLRKIFAYNNSKYESILDDPKSKLGKILSNFITSLVILFAFVFVFESV